MTLTDYRTLGRSGLAVSPLALGTMTFGTARWGSADVESRAIFNSYVDAGGNFIDSADVYAAGRSEEMIGQFSADRNLRHQLVIATKAGFSAGKGLANGGLSSSHLHASINASLRRLQTDYVDLYFAHTWDGVTPADELVETMASMVRAGKTRYWGMSNAPAWYVAQLATLARTRGLPGPIVLQYFYSLVNRDIEDEHVPLADDAGMGLMPWSPLAYGLLTGKYRGGIPEGSRGAMDNMAFLRDGLLDEKKNAAVAALEPIAAELGGTLAQLAIAWVAKNPRVSTVITGASKLGQLHANLAALSVLDKLTPEVMARIDALTAPLAD
jgi:aryl-alcohol dehydrogenase-like predicted oxidoreductase